MKYLTTHKVSEILGVTPQTLRNWDRAGKLKPHHTSANGYRYYTEDDVNMLLGVKSKTGKIVGYCRVNSPDKQEDLETQMKNMQTYLMAKGEPFKIITDVGSGFDTDREGLRELIRGMANRTISKVVILHKATLAHMWFSIIEYLAELYECDIEVIDSTEASERKELIKEMPEILAEVYKERH